MQQGCKAKKRRDVHEALQKSNYASKKDVQIQSKEECAEGRSNCAARRDAQVKLGMEENGGKGITCRNDGCTNFPKEE